MSSEWKIVPVRPSREMAEAAADMRGCKVSANLYATIRKAIAAAPRPVATEADIMATAMGIADEVGDGPKEWRLYQHHAMGALAAMGWEVQS